MAVDGTRTSAEGRGADDLVEVTGPAGNQPVFVSRDWVTAMATPSARPRSRAKAKSPTATPTPDVAPQPEPESKEASGSRSQAVQVAPCHPDTGALIDPAQAAATVTPAAPDLACEVDADTPPEPAQAHHPRPQAPRGAEPDIDSDRVDGASTLHRVAADIDSTRVDGASTLHRVAADIDSTRVDGASTLHRVAADIDSTRVDGASTLHRIAAGFGAGAYRPSASMAKRVKARDRRCRFPGCTVAAVFCDLDHVRPWPTGPTADTNLICLCRRHHRVKQRPGWAVALAPDGTVTWTDPTGRVRTTAPADALTCTVLGGAATPPPTPVSTSAPSPTCPTDPTATLEFHLEHLGPTAPPTTRGRRPHRHVPAASWCDSGSRQGVELTPTTGVILLEQTTARCRRPRRGRHTFPDEPPF